jgi:hypothetical protein
MVTVLIEALAILVVILLLVFSYYAKILDWIFICVAFLAVIAWAGAHNRIKDISASWSVGLYFSANIFWWIIKQNRRSWHNKVFWLTVGILMTVQISVFYFLLKNVGELKPIWLFLICLVEAPLIMMTLDWTLHQLGKQHRSHHQRHLT